MIDLGDRFFNSTIDFKFTTKRANGTLETLTDTPVISVYKNNSIIQTVVGITLTVDFDGFTGLNHIRIDTSALSSFYTIESDFDIIITTGSVRNTDVAGTKVASFSIEHRVGSAIGGKMIIPSQF